MKENIYGALMYGICLALDPDGRNEGNRPGMNDKGLVSFDRKIKKEKTFLKFIPTAKQ